MTYKDITADFGELYLPSSALLFYQSQEDKKNIYVEAYDMDGSTPINAHPLTVRESNALSKALQINNANREGFLKPTGLLPANVIYLDAAHNGCAIWYTRAQQVPLLFTEALAIPDGKYPVPPLLWKATRKRLSVFALKNNGGISEETPLFHAPFFNIGGDGLVCMGTVDINFAADCSLNQFIHSWENYFFNSRFSHLLINKSPVKGNVIQLWQSLVATDHPFPISQLRKNGFTIQNILP